MSLESKNLKIIFHKVKAYSGDQYNDLADESANSACLFLSIELNLFKVSKT
uniref:RNase H type-1 domain-containing protein n=1 Tax=Rhizophagus irregularis (strain DAOM 181602 / DAOM 197198 / MUCL 43194) TaxID=747089 RepID=U9TF67_RHIID